MPQTHRQLLPARSIAQPQPGFFSLRLCRNGPWVPAAIQIIDGKWNTYINGVHVGGPHPDFMHVKEIWRIWHGGTEVSAADYRRALAQIKADPADPRHAPRKPVDPRRLPPPF